MPHILWRLTRVLFECEEDRLSVRVLVIINCPLVIFHMEVYFILVSARNIV
jgi:hypothetical protein